VDEHTLSSRTKSGLFIEVTHLRSWRLSLLIFMLV
jgi:hypothetical protein